VFVLVIQLVTLILCDPKFVLVCTTGMVSQSSDKHNVVK